jgi:predicted DNA-binding helix-hairpin-helix protein
MECIDLSMLPAEPATPATPCCPGAAGAADCAERGERIELAFDNRPAMVYDLDRGAMDRETKLGQLAQSAVYDVSDPAERRTVEPRQVDPRHIFEAKRRGGGCMPLLKVLMTNACNSDCGYCANRLSRDCPRAAFRPEELAVTFQEIERNGLVSGLFLSSGLGDDSVRVMDGMIAAVEIIRRDGFRGYVHLKVLPGCERAQVERAVEIADRVSINLEAPTDEYLARLSAAKHLQSDILERMGWIRDATRGRRTDSTTQYVVGGAGETDLDLLTSTSELYRRFGLARAYYSAFRPVGGTPLECQAPASPIRQHRLYQADFLLREYGIGLSEMPLRTDGSLPFDEDPKSAMARRTLAHAPIEVNRADAPSLLRVPGIGMRSLNRILSARRVAKIREPDDLKKLGIRVGPALPYLLLDGRRYAVPPPVQIELGL